MRHREAVSAMLDAAGEQQSPKYMPDMTAPAVSISFAPPERAMAIKMTPMVPATPKEVPMA